MDKSRILRRFFGALLLMVGVLMALTCGSCTAYFGWIFIGEIWHGGAGAENIGILAIGIVPTILGLLLALSGWRMLRS